MLEKNVDHMKDCVPLNDMEKDKAFEEQVLYKERHRAQEAFFVKGRSIPHLDSVVRFMALMNPVYVAEPGESGAHGKNL